MRDAGCEMRDARCVMRDSDQWTTASRDFVPLSGIGSEE